MNSKTPIKSSLDSTNLILPNLIIGGPPKSGTTSLFEWLITHPEVCGASVKEPDYFTETNTSQNNFRIKGWEGYGDFYTHYAQESIILEASPKYIYSSTALSELQKISDLKMIFVYRNPVDRLYSEFRFHKYKTKNFGGSFMEYLGLQNDFDLKKLRKYELHRDIQKWVKKFGPDRVRLIRFEDISKSPADLMTRLSAFLELDASFFKTLDFRPINETVAIRNKEFHLWALRIRKLLPKSIRESLLPFYYRLNKSRIPEITEAENSLRKKLTEYFDESEKRLFEKFEPLFV